MMLKDSEFRSLLKRMLRTIRWIDCWELKQMDLLMYFAEVCEVSWASKGNVSLIAAALMRKCWFRFGTSTS
ncbi:MAG: hypothetical protein ACTS80_00375 [Candidatus Hodgkinia cicadicola]